MVELPLLTDLRLSRILIFLAQLNVDRPEEIRSKPRLCDVLDAGLSPFVVGPYLLSSMASMYLEMAARLSTCTVFRPSFCPSLEVVSFPKFYPVFVLSCNFGRIRYTLQRDAHLIADADDALRFFVGIFIKLGLLRTSDENPHFIIVNLAKLI
jgi:hypothetical protein